MSTYPIYPEAARHEMTRRLRAAEDERRRRLARHRRLARRSARRPGMRTGIQAGIRTD